MIVSKEKLLLLILLMMINFSCLHRQVQYVLFNMHRRSLTFRFEIPSALRSYSDTYNSFREYDLCCGNKINNALVNIFFSNFLNKNIDENITVICGSDYMLYENITLSKNSTLMFFNSTIHVLKNVMILMKSNSSLLLINSSIIFENASELRIYGINGTRFIGVCLDISPKFNKKKYVYFGINTEYILLSKVTSRNVNIDAYANYISIISCNIDTMGISPKYENASIEIFDSKMNFIEFGEWGYEMKCKELYIYIKNTKITHHFQGNFYLRKAETRIVIEQCIFKNVHFLIDYYNTWNMSIPSKIAISKCKMMNCEFVFEMDTPIKEVTLSENIVVNSTWSVDLKYATTAIYGNILINSSIFIDVTTSKKYPVVFRKNILRMSLLDLRLWWADAISPMFVTKNVFINSILRTQARFLWLAVKMNQRSTTREEQSILILMIANNTFIKNLTIRRRSLIELCDEAMYYVIANNTFINENSDKFPAIFIEGVFNYDPENPKESSFDICGNVFINFTTPLVIKARQKDVGYEGFYHTQIRIYLNSFFAENITLIDYGFEYDWAGYGNYWSCYYVLDRNNDGIGDEPIWFDNDSVDKRPLVYPHWKYNISYPIEYDEVTPQAWNRMISNIFTTFLLLSILALIGLIIWKHKEISRWMIKIFWGEEY